MHLVRFKPQPAPDPLHLVSRHLHPHPTAANHHPPVFIRSLGHSLGHVNRIVRVVVIVLVLKRPHILKLISPPLEPRIYGRLHFKTPVIRPHINHVAQSISQLAYPNNLSSSLYTSLPTGPLSRPINRSQPRLTPKPPVPTLLLPTASTGDTGSSFACLPNSINLFLPSLLKSFGTKHTP